MSNRQDRLGRLLRPSSIAFVGGKEATEAICQCRKSGYQGDIWPVHPKKTEVDGFRCFASLADLPRAPDAAFLGVNRVLTIDLVRQLSAMGAGGAVCYASGFKEAIAETGNGADLQEELIEAAGAMPFLGPNCYGCINYLDGALLWPDQHGGRAVEGGVAVLTQSSNIAINLTMQTRGLPVAYVLTAGNQAQCGLSDLASAALDDPRVTVLGLHIEGFDDLAAFEEMVLKARTRSVPVVVLKMGRSEVAQALTVSHTASLAGSDALADAFLARLGAARVFSVPAFLETLKLLHVHGPLAGTSIASMSCSGGEASLMADSAEGRAVSFRPLLEEDVVRVKKTLNDMVAVANPLDYHTFIWGDEDKLAATFTAMMQNGFDLSLLVLDFPRLDRCDDSDWELAVRALARASIASGGKAAVLATMPENLPEERSLALLDAGLAPLLGIDDAYAAIEAAAMIGAVWRTPPAERVLLPQNAFVGQVPGADDDTRSLNELDAKAALRAYGVPVPRGQSVASEEEAVSIFRQFDGPCVLKALRADLVHKSDVGGVTLGLQTEDELKAAFQAMAHLSDCFLLEEMASDPVAELIIGVSRDAQFGLHLVIGAGGILVELLKDSRSLLLPVTRAEIIEVLQSLRSAPLLCGYRGKGAVDLDDVADVALAIADYAMAHHESLLELDVNPLIVRPAGQGCVAVDAVLRDRVL